MKMIGRCLAVTVVSAILPVVLSIMLDENTVAGFLAILCASLLSSVAVIWTLGVDKNVRKLLIKWLKELPFRTHNGGLK
jgi:hypothetical protein